jgi:K+-transporting ATPase KdpF subunit
MRTPDEMRWAVRLDYTIGLLVSIVTLVYLVLAMVKPEKF